MVSLHLVYGVHTRSLNLLHGLIHPENSSAVHLVKAWHSRLLVLVGAVSWKEPAGQRFSVVAQTGPSVELYMNPLMR